MEVRLGHASLPFYPQTKKILYLSFSIFMLHRRPAEVGKGHLYRSHILKRTRLDY